MDEYNAETHRAAVTAVTNANLRQVFSEIDALLAAVDALHQQNVKLTQENAALRSQLEEDEDGDRV